MSNYFGLYPGQFKYYIVRLSCLNLMVNVAIFVLAGTQSGWIQAANSNQPPVGCSNISSFTEPL